MFDFVYLDEISEYLCAWHIEFYPFNYGNKKI